MRFPLVTVLLFAVLTVAVREIPAALHVVVGDSMVPTLLPGDTLVINRFAYRHSPPQPGDILVFRDPRTQVLAVKRVRTTAEDQRIYLTGDNHTESIDSRHFGAIQGDLVVGKVLFHGPR